MQDSKIIIPDEKKLNKIISNMAKDGKDKLHIISDFDKTLTKATVEGQKAHTVIAQIREGEFLTKDYPQVARQLFERYHPKEIDTKIPPKEKSKIMHEWWKKHFDLIVESGLTKKIIRDIVNKMKISFRGGSFDFLEELYKNNIPIIIMSAGPGDLILEYLRSENKFFSNIHLIANIFIWDKDGKAIGTEEPIIHSLNKHETEIKKLPVYNQLLKRRNVILLGDNLEDIKMIEGFPYKNLIKIGFLNENMEENMEIFKKSYDIIITNDSDMNYVNELLGKIINS